MLKSTSAARPTASPTTQAGATAARTSAAATGATPPPTKARFESAAETLQYLKRSYIPGIKEHAQNVEARLGREARDQDHPVETVRVVPPHPELPPLLIVGGMGPLAGAQAMEAALQRFGDSREIVLLQLCSVPDRTGALDEDERLGAPSDTHQRVVAAIKDGFASGEDTIERPWAGQGHTVVVCNTAHNFAPQAFAVYQQERAHNARLQMHSLVTCVVAALAQSRHGQQAPVMILGTHGTLRTRLYLQPLEANGVRCAVPEPHGQKLLGDAIYKGVKASREEKTIAYGNALFLELKARGQILEGKPFVILAGCTEVPEIVNVLREKGDPEVKALLAHAQVADPMAITLAHIAKGDAAGARL